MMPSYRVLRLAGLAVLLPCLLIGVLSYQWLTVERQAAAHRHAEAAQRLITELRHDLSTELGATGELAARVLAALPPDRPVFQQAPSIAPLISAAYVFDPSAKPLTPTDQAGSEHLINEYRRHKANPDSQHPGVTAASRLARARQALANGNPAVAEQHAAEIPVCCAGARDEYGVSFALYGAHLRVTASEGRASFDETVEQIARELRQLILVGHLGAPEDSIQLRLLAAKAKHATSIAGLVATLEEVSVEIAERNEFGRLAAQWVAQVDLRAIESSRPVFAALGRGPAASAAALSRTSDGTAVVMLIDSTGLDRWVGQWAAGRATGRIDVRRVAGGPPAAGLLELPLFVEAPGVATLVLGQTSTNPATERTRRQLFVAAVVVVVVLTMVIGYLAARDVSRELHTAALRSTFVASVTHELKTPLASIRLLAETLRRGRARPEATAELLDTIVEETDRLGRLVDNVLSSSRIESGTRGYNPQPVSLRDAVRDALGRFDYVLKKEGFAADIRLPDEALTVRVDQDALGQAVLNLLGNAVKYSGDSRAIRVGLEQRNGRGVISVADAGIGVAPASRARIFDNFYRAPEAAAATTGAGLGLALVQHFAEAHGGEITVDSEPGRGSVFSISLPLIASSGTQEPSRETTPDTMGATRHA
jgi:two-component system phosphate regulon sensor histidine kinase PhoR